MGFWGILGIVIGADIVIDLIFLLIMYATRKNRTTRSITDEEYKEFLEFMDKIKKY